MARVIPRLVPQSGTPRDLASARFASALQLAHFVSLRLAFRGSGHCNYEIPRHAVASLGMTRALEPARPHAGELTRRGRRLPLGLEGEPAPSYFPPQLARRIVLFPSSLKRRLPFFAIVTPTSVSHLQNEELLQL